MRITKKAILSIAASVALLSPAAGAQTPAADAIHAVVRCSLRAYYADKRPYESPNSDPFFAAFVAEDAGVLNDFHRRTRGVHDAARLIIRTKSGYYEKIVSHPGASEFTLPTHESVTAAWVDGIATPDGTMESCDPSGAFFVDGFHDAPFTKLLHRQEMAWRYTVGKATHLPDLLLLPLEPLTTLRNLGRRPAGTVVASATPCNEPERSARPLSNLVVPFDEPAGVDGPPSVLVDVSPLGSVMSVDIEQSSHSHAFDTAMLEAAAKQQFTPARWHCTNVPDRVIVGVWFSSPLTPSMPSTTKMAMP